MKTEVKRVVIYPKDVQRITGKSYRFSLMHIKDIRKHFQKEEHQFISFYEFCDYSGLNIEEVLPLIVD